MARVISFEGRQISVPDDFTDAEIAKVLAAPSPAAAAVNQTASQVAQSAPNQPTDNSSIGVDEIAKRKHLDQANGYQSRGFFPAIDAATEGSQAGVMGGYDDEIGAAMTAPINAVGSWATGNGFDIGKEYTKTQAALDARKAQRREAYPKASIAGEIAGGLALPGLVRVAPAAIGPSLMAPAASRMPTLIGRDLPLIGKVGATAAEGAGYGALYGSGEAKPGERVAGAESGAIMGAGLGTLLHGAGSALSRALPKPSVVPAPTQDAMAAEAHALYDGMRQSGIAIKQPVIQRLKQNISASLRGTNDTLAPKAFGLQKLAAKTISPTPGIDELHNFAKAVNRVLRTKLEGEDAHYVGLIKTQIEHLIDNINPATDITGANSSQAFQLWKQADALWAKAKKTEIVNNILDIADVKGTGQYTQSGLANAVRREMLTLYKSIAKGRSKGWSKEEIALIRQMAKGGSNSATINLLSKFAPRGVVSALGGFALGGPGLTIAGHLAGQAADRGAVNAATTLRDAAARGYTIPAPQLTNRVAPLVPGITGASTEEFRRLLGAQ